MKGAIAKAKELAEKHGYFMPQQFENEANPEVHRLTTGPEIVKQMGDQLDGFVAGIGTGGTITGAGQVLREHYPNIKIVAVNRKIRLFYPVANQVPIKSRESEPGLCRKY